MSQIQTINEEITNEDDIQTQISLEHDPFYQQENPFSQQTPQSIKRHRVRNRPFYPSTIRIIFGHLISVFVFLIRQLFRSNNLPFLLTFIWHSFSLKRLLFSSRKYLKRYTIRNNEMGASHAIANDVVKRLGGMNSSLALLALLALTRFSKDMGAQKVSLLVLATANGAQTWLDFKSWKNGRWNWSFLTESGGGNVIIAIVNMVAYGVSVVKTRSIL
ncbi:uncharacterized protein OCT59_028398 [Rhizophagus irregularis]|uniref:Uncharacterized protein n=6 Tax=Rhizophagus irregularis TaxID=588596 RepID=A0A015I6Y4_RHIIW|nr:hypothetical protein GLOIN_2v1658039 [Rhizophagus irregularis DAOM 181602=DAOM 197198]EXX52832.1 hypothetical protein RirG_249530 [Rhizophagus irregularis DAOM 197198w]POG66355.1 hypothetical protein GLOIN_2v1658039 [Rhizophagus irregularis DAOM 181602=DAOM 197198]UZO08134.1 hypothetical protein OCT59_028398 [Rhizophagus irregularis]|eukprot:XP_025173221.1 hypothetical protein GLOIN_2v1658039 [Rhizophagus irregularis DAOM 181602=DAOM 197198]